MSFIKTSSISEILANAKYSTILIFVVSLDLIALVQINLSFGFIGTDAVFYAEMARSIIEGHGLVVYGVPHTIYSPLLAFLIAPFYALGFPLDLAAHIPVIAFAAITIFGVYFIGREIYSDHAGLLAALFLGSNGMYLWSAAVSPSPQYISGLFSLIALLCLLQILRMAFWRAIILALTAGFLIGLAYLARPEYFFLIFPAVICVAVFVFRACGRKRALWIAASIFAAFAISVSPYLLYLHQELGYWTISGRGNELVLITTSENYEKVDQASGAEKSTVIAPPMLEKSAVVIALSDFSGLIKRFADNLVNTEHTFLRLFGTIGTFFAGFGLWSLIRKRQYWELSLLASFLSPVVLVAYAQGGSSNYLVQFFFLITPLIAVGVLEVTQEASEIFRWSKQKKLWIQIVIAIVASLYFLLPAIQNVLFLPNDYRDQEYKEIGLWMNKNVPNIEHETVVSRKPEPTFYARSLWSIIPNATSTQALREIMIERDQRYVIADDRTLSTSRPELADLLIPGVVERDFLLLYQTQYHGKRVYLYQVRKE